MIILSHPRSGLHWLYEIIKVNAPGIRVENTRKHLKAEAVPKIERGIILCRDVKNSLVSTYVGNRARANLHLDWKEGVNWRDRSFKDFLIWKYRDGLNPVVYWTQYYHGWLGREFNKHLVKYEDLFKIETIEKLLKWLEVKRKPKLVGQEKSYSEIYQQPRPGYYMPRTVGNWRNLFDVDDLEYVQSIAGDTMRKLGYE